MPTTVTLPGGKTKQAHGVPLDASVFGVVLPVLTSSPTDSMWGVPPPDGTMVIEASVADTGFILWARINGTWRLGVIA